MPMYAFQTESGEDAQLFYLMEDAPRIGDWVEVDGVRYQRKASFQIDAGLARKVWGYPYVSNQYHPNELKGAKTIVENGREKPIIESRSQEREIAAMNDMVKD
jgi:hypothetical protein